MTIITPKEWIGNGPNEPILGISKRMGYMVDVTETSLPPDLFNAIDNANVARNVIIATFEKGLESLLNFFYV